MELKERLGWKSILIVIGLVGLLVIPLIIIYKFLKWIFLSD